MKSAPLPQDEDARLERLKTYQVLDTPAEDAFDRITRIVAKTIGVPIALVSLIDEKRQWFKSEYGINAGETSREIAFCAHAILGDETFIVEDALEDDRFNDNPLVTEAPSIRFYAGAPLRSPEGLKLGTLCAIDSKPRTLSADHQQLLEDLARFVVDELELRLAVKRTMDQVAEEAKLRQIQDEFFATMSHELRTPLTSIRGSLALLENGVAGALPEKAANMISIANISSMRLLDIVNDLLDIHKLEAGKLNFNFATTDIVPLLKETCNELQGYALKKQLSFVLSGENSATIMADPFRLRQVFTNLISNAIKFSKKNAAIEIAVKKDLDAISISITDHGEGIPLEAQGALFNRFAQAESKQKSIGSGLGLVISKAIVDAHNGTISFVSSPGLGTTFTVQFPTRQSIIAI